MLLRLFGSCLHCIDIKLVCKSFSVPSHRVVMVRTLKCLLSTLSTCLDSFVKGVENELVDFGLIISLAHRDVMLSYPEFRDRGRQERRWNSQISAFPC